MTVSTTIAPTGVHAGGVTEHLSGEVSERARRRTFTAACTLSVLAEYEAAGESRHQISTQAEDRVHGRSRRHPLNR
jgi:hypothetical protein